MIYFLEYAAVSAVTALLNILPISWRRPLANQIANIAFLFLSKRRKIVIQNLHRAFGDTRRRSCRAERGARAMKDSLADASDGSCDSPLYRKTHD